MTNRYDQAEPLFRQVLAVMEKTDDANQQTIVALTRNGLGVICLGTNRYAEAESLLKQALTAFENNLGADHPRVAVSLIFLATVYMATNQYDEAESVIKRSTAMLETASGEAHALISLPLLHRAILYRATGRYSESEPLFKRSLTVAEQAFGAGHHITLQARSGLSNLYYSTGRYAEAESMLKQALTDMEKTGTSGVSQIATNLSVFPALQCGARNFSGAESLFRQTLTLSEKLMGEEHIYTALTRYYLAELYRNTGRYAEAEPLYKQSLKMLEDTLDPGNASVALVLNGLTELCIATGRYEEAGYLCRRSLAITAKAGNPEFLYKAQGNYSTLHEKQDNPEAAIFFGKQGVNTIQTLRKNVAQLGKDTLKTFTETVEGSYKRLSKLLIEQGRLAEAQQVMAMLKEEEYFQYIRRDAGDSGKLDTKATFTATEEPWHLEYEKLSAANAKLGKELGDLRVKEQKGMLTEAERPRYNQLLDEEQKASEAFNTFITRLVSAMREEADKLAKQSKGERDKRLAELNGKNLAGSYAIMQTLAYLGEGAVLIHYLIMDDRIHILLTTPDTQLARHSDIKVKDLNSKISALLEVLSNPNIDPRPLAKELHTVLIAPIEKELQQAKAQTLMLSLDGTLRYLPFAALYDGKEYLAQQYRTVMYAEVAKDKVAMPANQTWKVAALGVSDKVSDAFSELPSVTGELNGIVIKGDQGVIPGELHLNGAFTEKQLQQSASRNPVVHIASHFRFSPGTEKDSFLLLGDGSNLTLDKVRKGTYFRNTELLTLSACETAKGSKGNGSEIEGFGAIAMDRGAKAVIATLWSVADDSTSLLMLEFYKLHVERKLAKVEALRQAQLSLLNGTAVAVLKSDKERSKLKSQLKKDAPGTGVPYKTDPEKPFAHPYFWAPFILMGNWK